jgi:biopolymer transport protein ExbD
VKFPRNARIFRGQLDAAPFAMLFFLLVLFLMVASLVYTPGVALRLPTAEELPGTDKPTVAVAVDAAGRLYYENQGIQEKELRAKLSEAAKQGPEPPTLILQADRAVTFETLLRLNLLARDVGITNSLLAALRRPLSSSP